MPATPANRQTCADDEALAVRRMDEVCSREKQIAFEPGSVSEMELA